MHARLIAAAVALSSCAAMSDSAPPAAATGLSLTGPEWRVLYFRSNDDAIGIVRPAANEVYTLSFQPDGKLTARLACNNGAGTWTSPDAKQSRGSLEIGPIASTMRGCVESDLARFPVDLSSISSFVIAEGQLNLNLKADGGDYVLEPIE